MRVPASPHFTTIPLQDAYTVERSLLPAALRAPADIATAFGTQSLLGIPFDMGETGKSNVILLEDEPIRVEFGPRRATYILFAHVVADRVTNYQTGFADFAVDGNELGNHVADYTLVYADQGGTYEASDTNRPGEVTVPIVRRFAIQQARIGWGASPAAALPHVEPGVFSTTTEEQMLGRVPTNPYGRGETRHSSPRDRAPEKIWLYALPNPNPDRPIARVVLTPREEPVAIYAITTTELTDHPLRPGVRRKLRLKLPPGAQLNGLGEMEGLAIDLGTVISARAVLRYDAHTWQPGAPVAEPVRAGDEVIVEYAAHPAAKLYVPTTADPIVYDLADEERSGTLIHIAPALRPVKLRVLARSTGRPVPVRLHLHGEAGEYLPPRGHHRKVNGYWFEDNYGEFVNVHNQYAYIDGECEVDLPLGTVYVEIMRGYETTPIRDSFTVTADTDTVTFHLDKVLRWREKGWVTADTHVHFLTPQTALLEGQAEDVHVVNLLASQWGEMFSNVADFDGGKTTFGAREFGGDGEFLVRVGTENRMQVLGHISLLGYRGEMIHPLCSGGPSESAIGDPLEVTMAEWAKRCIDQGGLTVMPHAPNPQLERAADIVLGLVNAIEMMSFNPLNPALAQINPYGVADWYRYLNLGYHVPVVGGSDKMAASSLLGGIRTYAHLGDREFTYDNWMEAVRAGNTFVTVGPLTSIEVDGNPPGSRIDMNSGGTVHVTWRVESVSLPIEQVEIVVGGLAVEQITPDSPLEASGQTTVRVDASTWIALRVRGSYRGQHGEIAAHTSAIQLMVEGKPLFNQADAGAVLDQIQGAIAYVDTLAPRPAAQRFKQMRATLESAYNHLHQRMHRAGLFHRHTPIHEHAHPHEH